MRVFSVSVGLSSLNVYVLAPRYRGHASEDARPGSSPSLHVSTSAPFSFFSLYLPDPQVKGASHIFVGIGSWILRAKPKPRLQLRGRA